MSTANEYWMVATDYLKYFINDQVQSPTRIFEKVASDLGLVTERFSLALLMVEGMKKI